MIPIIPSILRIRLFLWLGKWLRRPLPAARRLLPLLPLAGLFLVSSSCESSAPLMPIVDVTPLGEGLQVIGYAIVGAAVLGVLGKLIK